MKKLFGSLLLFALMCGLAACGAAADVPLAERPPAGKVPGAPLEYDWPERTFGGIVWLELARKGNKTLLLSRDILALRAFDEADEPFYWADCGLRAYLNEDFIAKNFTDDEHARIALTLCENTAVAADFPNSAGSDTQDRVFLLSYQEVLRYMGGSIQANPQRAAALVGDSTRAAETWWLRSPGDGWSGCANVDALGQVCYSVTNVKSLDLGVRPALWLLDNTNET